MYEVSVCGPMHAMWFLDRVNGLMIWLIMFYPFSVSLFHYPKFG